MNTKQAFLLLRLYNGFTACISLLSPMAVMTSCADLSLQAVKLRREF